jgi:hypothetical protein
MVYMPTAIEPDPESFDGLMAGAVCFAPAATVATAATIRPLRSWDSGASVFRPQPRSCRGVLGE